MVVASDKRPLSWYLITLKLRERMCARKKGLPILSPKSGSFEQPQQQQFAPLGELVNRNAEKHDIESHPPEGDRSSLIETHPSEDDWVNTIKEKLGAASQYDAALSRKNVSIYRVPAQLKDPSHLQAFTPQVVSLGPYHHGTAPLQKMERHKWRFLHHVLKRRDQNVELYLDSMRELEDSVRACYEEQSELTSNQFVEMMLLDGCFILEVLQGSYKSRFENRGYSRNDPIFSTEGTIMTIKRDMMMLENQFPFFVLDKLLDLQGEELGVQEFGDFGGLHELSFRRKLLLHGLPERVVEGAKHQFLNYSATELRNAGLKLRKGHTDKSLLNIEFKNGILYIPPIQIHDASLSFYRNAIAFEQCHFGSDQHHVASYVSFLDDLIDSPEDVRYLKNHGIIEQLVGSDAEVADIINSLGYGVTLSIERSYLGHLSWQINEFRNQRWNIWWKNLKEKYFNNPWTITSLIAAVLLLLLTAAQTFYAACGYYRLKT